MNRQLVFAIALLVSMISLYIFPAFQAVVLFALPTGFRPDDIAAVLLGGIVYFFIRSKAKENSK